MDDVWFWGIQGHAVVSDVLCGVEDSEGEAVQELALSEEAAHWLESPTSLLLQVLRDVVELGDRILSETYMLLELIDCPVELLARIGLEKLAKPGVAVLPHLLLRLVVIYDGDIHIIQLIVKGCLSNHSTSLTVLFVIKTGVIGILDAVSGSQDSLADSVEVDHLCGEPGNLRSVEYVHSKANFLQLTYAG